MRGVSGGWMMSLVRAGVAWFVGEGPLGGVVALLWRAFSGGF